MQRLKALAWGWDRSVPEAMLILRAGFREPQGSAHHAGVTAFGHIQGALPACPCGKHLQRAAQIPAHTLPGAVFYLERKTSPLLAQFSPSAEQLINHCLKENTSEMLPTWLQGACWTLPGPFVLANLWHRHCKLARRGCWDAPKPVRSSPCSEG